MKKQTHTQEHMHAERRGGLNSRGQCVLDTATASYHAILVRNGCGRGRRAEWDYGRLEALDNKKSCGEGRRRAV